MTHSTDTGIIEKDVPDSKMDPVVPPVRSRASRWLWSRLALGLSPTPLPGALLLIGLGIGPSGINLLSRNMLGYLDPAVSVALAALGVLIGLGFDLRRPDETRLLSAATIEAALVMMLVGTGLFLAQPILPGSSPLLMAFVLGICASASSTLVLRESAAADSPAGRIGDLDDVLPILLGGVLLATLREASPGAVAWLTLESIGLAVAVAYGSWLLIAQSTSESEQRVFTIGGVLLLGGAAEFLSISALWMGLFAGIVWNLGRGDTRERIASEIRFMQHPLVVLLLLIAGARASFSAAIGIFIVLYIVLRLIGKLAGGRIVRQMVSADLPPQYGIFLISPGVISIAFALNVQSANAEGAAELLSIVVGGSFLSELISRVMRSKAEP
jgi:hypothetical protein